MPEADNPEPDATDEPQPDEPSPAPETPQAGQPEPGEPAPESPEGELLDRLAETFATDESAPESPEGQQDEEGAAGTEAAEEQEDAGEAAGTDATAGEGEQESTAGTETAAEGEEKEEGEEEGEEKEEEDEFGVDQRRMSFGGHLSELRVRVLICVAAISIVFVIFFVVLREELYNLLTLPIKEACGYAGVPYERLLFSKSPVSMFATSAYFCAVAAIALTVPITLHQIWAFVRPGLKRRERKAVVPILLAGTGLFVVGVVFAYKLVIPLALRFLITDTSRFQGMALLWSISDTLKFETMLLLVFGVAFELPIVVIALTYAGVIKPEMIARKRRHAIVIMFILGAVLTPPDVVTQLLLAVPMIVLLEISIQISKFIKPRTEVLWEKWERQGQEPEGGSPGGQPATAGAAASADEGKASETEAAEGTDAHGEEDYSGEDHDPYDDYESGYHDDWDDQYGYEQEEEKTPEEKAREEELERLRKDLHRKRGRRPREQRGRWPKRKRKR